MPFGVIAGRVVGGVDVRQYGSGSTGTTNVLRTVGRRAAVAVLLLDMGKSVVAVLLAQLLTDSAGVEVATALAAIAGHIWPVFAGFRGGKGISVGWSALFVLSPISGLVAT
ncbi:MAG: glycerol-3-phosphate acyltransferase, partial [SAR202 cluster bacterium]|nr:glycerol-3-phosphate acyltransferase [SAR202 cluster bacterium]